MTWQTGTSDGYLALLQDLLDIATNSNVNSVAVNAGGTGYAVGDILTINGGTVVGGHTAAVEVLTLTGSAVATVRIARGGAYTVNPGTGATTTAETGAGTGCTVNTTIAATGWTIQRRTQEAVSAVVTAGGSGHSVGDKLTVVNLNGAQGQNGVDAIFIVATLSGSAVATVTLDTAGNYEETTGNAALTTSNGAGTGCTLTVTYQDATTQDQVVVLSGTPGSGYATQYVAIETYQEIDQFTASETCYNWAFFGLETWNPALPLFQQSNHSIGHDPADSTGIFLARSVPNIPLKVAEGGTPTYPLSFYFSITGRRIIGIVEVTDATPIFHYPSFYIGYLNQAGTRLEFPYPMYIGAACWRAKSWWGETTPFIGGLMTAYGYLPGDADADGQSSAYFYDSGNKKWYASLNFAVNDGGTTINTDATYRRHGIYPLIGHYAEYDDDVDNKLDVFGTTIPSAMELVDEIIDRNLPSTPSVQLLPTPNGADNLYLLIPLSVIARWLDAQGPGAATQLDDIFGELDSCFWVPAYPIGDVNSLDTFLLNGIRYRVFQNGNRTEAARSYMVVCEE